MDAIDLPKLKKLIRSLLISCPRGMPARDLAADFRNTMGRPLPFQNFGYRSLDEFIRTIPDVVRVSPGPNGEKFYYGVATAETQHVARLVATQKKPPAHRCAKPSACVRPTGFTKKGLAGPRGRYSAGPGKRGKPMKEELNGNSTIASCVMEGVGQCDSKTVMHRVLYLEQNAELIVACKIVGLIS